MNDTEQIAWNIITKTLNEKFGVNDELETILMFIGIQELGQGFRNFDKQEKTDLMTLATCKVLSYFEYYRFKGNDRDHWPLWVRNKPIPKLTAPEQENLIKKGIICYFEKNDLLNS